MKYKNIYRVRVIDCWETEYPISSQHFIYETKDISTWNAFECIDYLQDTAKEYHRVYEIAIVKDKRSFGTNSLEESKAFPRAFLANTKKIGVIELKKFVKGFIRKHEK